MECAGCGGEIGPQDARLLLFAARFEGQEVPVEPERAFHGFDCLDKYRESMNAPTAPPLDTDEERARLIDDATNRGVDEGAALKLAEALAHLEPLPSALRDVDRRLALGHSLEETAEILEVAPVTDEPSDMTTREFELDEPGFRGTLRIAEADGGLHVYLLGERPIDGSVIQKDVPADRDERLTELVIRCLQNDQRSAVDILSHVGVLDPEPS
jgi:hypothetical protein